MRRGKQCAGHGDEANIEERVDTPHLGVREQS
jgi:hypothetical protein